MSRFDITNCGRWFYIPRRVKNETAFEYSLFLVHSIDDFLQFSSGSGVVFLLHKNALNNFKRKWKRLFYNK